MPESNSRQFRFGTYVLHTRSRELCDAAGVNVAMTPRAFDTLCFLVENRDRIVGKDEILQSVWAGRVVEENNLTQAVSALRRALAVTSGDHRYVVTVPGKGYRFVANVEEVEDDEGSRSVSDQIATGTNGTFHDIAKASWSRHKRAAGAFLILLTLCGLTLWYVHGRSTSSPGQSQLQATLAVLPFRSLSPGEADELLELGLADTLIARLSHFNALRVRALNSAQRVALLHHDPVAAGRQLGAAYVLEGSTQRELDHVRVNTRLLSVADGSIAWSGTFDARLDRVFMLQDEIAQAVSSALALQRLVEPSPARSDCDGDNAEAFRAYLRGRYLLERPSRSRLEKALAAYRQAIDLDPSCARAYAGMALAYRGLTHVDVDPREVFPLAKAAVDKALRIDPNSAEALVSQGRNQQLYDWAWADAEVSLTRAIAINPSLVEAHFAYAHLLSSLGRFDEALSHAVQARELDPLSPLINALEAGFLTAAQRPDDALRALARALELQPDFWIALLIRGGMALDRGDTSAAIADLQIASEKSLGASQVLAMLAVAHVAAGEPVAARAILKKLQARTANGYVPATSFAAVHSALGDTDLALDFLERAFAERDIRLSFIKVDARWNNLRTNPRFRELSSRLGLEAEQAHGRY